MNMATKWRQHFRRRSSMNAFQLKDHWILFGLFIWRAKSYKTLRQQRCRISQMHHCVFNEQRYSCLIDCGSVLEAGVITYACGYVLLFTLIAWDLTHQKHILACCWHYCDVIMGAVSSQITSLTIVYPTVYSDTYQENIKAPRHWLCASN